MDKQSLSWKLLFRLCNNVSLIRQIELLSFLLTANRPAVYAYWVTKPSIFFPEKQAIHTLAIEPQMRSEKFKLPLPSTIIYTSHRNIWLLLHICSRLRRQPSNTRPHKQSLRLYMSLSFKNPSKSSLQTIRRERKETPWGFLLPVLWRCKQKPLFKVRLAVHPRCTSAPKPAKSPWFVTTIGASSRTRHIHIHELSIYSGELWACSYNILHERWNDGNLQTIWIP